MKQKNPIESLLRSPVEWYSAVIFLFIGIIFIFEQRYLMLLFWTGVFIGSIFMILGSIRFYQGYRIMRYQKNLTRLPLYTIKSKNIPFNSTKLFLGRGFKWEIKHTQRLMEARQRWTKKTKKAKKYFDVGKDKQLSAVGGNSVLHGVELQEKEVWMNLSERVGHTLVLGTTRVGKTRLLELLVSQDIKRGETVIVFDPKGDADLLRRLVYEAKECGRAEDCLIFHLGFPEVSARYNPIGHFVRITEVANRISNQLPSSGESAAFKEFAWRFVNIIAKALVALGLRPDYKKIQRYILNIDELLLEYCKLRLPNVDADWEKSVKKIEDALDIKNLPLHMRVRSRKLIAVVEYVRKKELNDSTIEGLCSAFSYDKTYYDKITASLLPLIEKLTTGKIADLISPDYEDLNDHRPIFDWMQVIRGKKIVYIGLDALSDSIVASAVGNSMFSDLCSVAGQIYKYGIENKSQSSKIFHPISIHADEFNELIGDESIPLLNKGGGAGIQMTLYTQTGSDIEAKLGSKAKSGQVEGNLNTIICMRVLDEETAKILTDKLPQSVPIHTLLPSTTVTDTHELGSGPHFISSNDDRICVDQIPLLTPNDLIQLPKGQAFALIEGGQLWKIRIPLPKDDLSGIPQEIEALADWLRNQEQNYLDGQFNEDYVKNAENK